MAKTTKILIAVGAIVGGVRDIDGNAVPFTLVDGKELTDEAAAKLGLSEDAVATLVERGQLAEVEVREAEAIGADELAEAITRAAAAEAEVATLKAKVKELEKKKGSATPTPSPTPTPTSAAG